MVAVNPDSPTPASRTPGVSAAERRQLVHDWNATHREFPNLCAHQLFEQQAARTPDAVAVVCAGEEMTYRELNERTNQVAHCLRRRSAGPESLVGVCLGRSPALVVALLGVWKAGAAYVPLDPAYPAERLAFMAADAELRLLLVDSAARPLFAEASGQIVCLDTDWPTIAQESRANPAVAVVPDSLAYVMYTSGSTGQPKGAMIVHSGLVNYLCWAIEAYGLDETATVPVHSSIAFDLTVTSLYPPLLVGGRVDLLPEDAGAQNLLAALRHEQPHSLVKITPAHLDLLAGQLAPDELAAMSKTFVIGGESLSAESLRPWRQHAPQTRLINEYGPTETVVGCCVYEVRADDPDGGPVPIGRPIANTRLYVLDDAMQLVPPGVAGELYIGGVGVARGYLNRPELTAQRFLADPFADDREARLYRTGDLARYRPDGILEYLGRTDSQVKLRGYRIELGDIEANLAAHPAVRAGAVVVREDEPGNRQLVAYVVFAPEMPSTAGDLADFLKRRLPDYMLPAQFVRLDALPLTVNGKVDRAALPAPSAANLAPTGQFVAPRSEGERLLAVIWGELLKMERIGIDDDFFDCGGHSLLAIKAVSRIRDVFGIDMKIQTLFDHPTIAALSPQLGGSGATGQLPRIEARQASGPCPLSFAQEHLWFMDQLAPGNPVYNIVDMIRLDGPYHAAALGRALAELVRRHEMLRTAFFEHHGQAVQIVLPEIEVALPELDLSDCPAAQREDEWHRVVQAQGRQAFVLAQPPLWRWQMVHLSEREHRLLLVVHHIVADEWAMNRLHQEIHQLYAAFALGRPSPLAELPIQYADFACWQRQHLTDAVLAGEIAYWRAELAGAPQVLELATDRPRPPVQSFRGGLECFTVPAPLAERVKALGRREQATLFMVLEAAFMALLHRYTGQDDLLVGTPISGRRQSETENLIGYFLNILVLRARFTEGISFRRLLQQVRSRSLAAYAHAELPFQRLVAELAPARDPGRSPLFQAMFVLHDGSGASQVSSLSGQRALAIGTAKFDLTLLFSDTGAALEGAIEYSTDLFEAATMQRFAGHCLTLLEAIVDHPDQAIDQLPLLTAAERRQLLVDWNDSAVAYPADALLHRLFEAQAARTPDAVAVVCEARQLTYRELDARSNRLARHLQCRGVGPDGLVAVYAERSLEMVVALLAILKAGGAYLPIDPQYPPQRVAAILDEAQPPVLLSQAELRARLPAGVPILCLDSDWGSIAGESAAPLASPVSADNLAYAIYTSGSTGRPKGILISHAAICNHMFWLQRTHPLGPDDALLQKTPFGFDASVWEFFAPLLAGGRLVMARPGGHLEPAYLAETIRSQRITILQLVPSLLRMLLAEPAFWRCAPPLRRVFCGGEALTAELVDEFRRRLPQVPLTNLYGPSETTIDATCLDLAPQGDFLRGAVDGENGPISIGRPVDNVRAYIVDRHLQPLPVGVPGQLLIGGHGLARGYLGQPELTADKFVADPFRDEPGARVYKTGDLARYRPDGSIEFLGRLDHQVKVRGFRIELGEIETCLARHPAIRQAVVVARDDASATRQLVAYLVAEQPPVDLAEQLRILLRGALPDYMVPAAFVSLDKLPLTASGKVDRQALPAPLFDDPAQAARAVDPRTASETLILDMFRTVLGRADFGVLDSFFDLGGHSIMAAQLMARLEDESGLRLPLRNLFERPTVAGLAEIVDGLAWLSRPRAPSAEAGAREEIEL